MNEILTPSAQVDGDVDPALLQPPDHLIDELLGIPEDDDPVWKKTVNKRYGGLEQTYYEGTSYERIREILNALGLKASDVVYDLGCGYGRLVFYGALTTEAQFRGIELVPERVRAARAIKERFAIANAEIIEGNVLDQDFSDGNIFYMFSPFSQQTLQQVLDKLRVISLTKPITIVSYCIGNTLDSLPWLGRINKTAHPFLRFYQSTPPLPALYVSPNGKAA